MHLYDYTPPKNNSRLFGIIICLASLGIGPFLFSLIIKELPFKWVFQLISIISLTAIIFIITRYIAKNFLYSVVRSDNDGVDFTVTEITNGGRSKITVCRISVSGIESAEVFDRNDSNAIQHQKEIEKKAKKEGRKSFNYCPDINPVQYSIIIGEECGEKFLIKLTPDEMLCEYLGDNR